MRAGTAGMANAPAHEPRGRGARVRRCPHPAPAPIARGRRRASAEPLKGKTQIGEPLAFPTGRDAVRADARGASVRGRRHDERTAR